MKRKKYSEELEARLSDDEVKVIVKAKKTNTAVRKEPAVQLFVVSRCAPEIQNRRGLWRRDSVQSRSPAVWKRERLLILPFGSFSIPFVVVYYCVFI